MTRPMATPPYTSTIDGVHSLFCACWLPVVWIQIRLRQEAKLAAERNQATTSTYWRFFTAWMLLCIPAFFAFLVIFYLMVAKPV